MSVWFTSDLHLGHIMIAETRKFMSIDDHDHQMVENINDSVNKRDKLYILGDLAFSDKGMKWAHSIRCQNVELILGNHDKYPVKKYLDMGWKLHGFRGYRDYWLSHCPIHPNEIRMKKGNLHGHIHIFGDTQAITDPRYLCVNPEFHQLKPISFESIEKMMELRKDAIAAQALDTERNKEIEFYESRGDTPPERI